jgi:hypothetical protein
VIVNLKYVYLSREKCCHDIKLKQFIVNISQLYIRGVFIRPSAFSYEISLQNKTREHGFYFL